jgi:hypothetical protein
MAVGIKRGDVQLSNRKCMMKKPSSPARTAQPPHRRLLLSRDNKQHGIIRRALTLTANVSIISKDGQEEGSADEQPP